MMLHHYYGTTGATMKISGLTILRNGMDSGYTFIETIKTLLTICDEVIVIEGYSTDNTMEALATIKSDKVKIIRQEWNLQSNAGLEFAKITNEGMKHCSGDYIFYLQADELIHEDECDKLRDMILSNQHNSIMFSFVHLRYDVLMRVKELPENKARRVVRNLNTIYSSGDAFDFAGTVNPGIDSGIIVYHAGYIFPYNIVKKMINHANYFYVQEATYKHRASEAAKFLKRMDRGESISITELNQTLEPYYQIVEHNLPIPALLQPHIGKFRYLIS